MKTIIVYHRVDWDGYTSAAVALRAFPGSALFGWTYNDPVPDVSEYDQVIVVDLSLPEDWMLANASKLVWIDHHANVIATLEQNEILAAVPGIRRDGMGACALAWAHFFPGQDMPTHIRYAATADVMDHECKLISLRKALAYALYLDTFGPGYIKEVGDVSKYHVGQALRLFNKEDMIEGFYIGDKLENKRAAHEEELFEQASTVQIGDMLGCVLPIDGRPNACILTHLLNSAYDFFVCIGSKVDDKYKISIRVPRDSDFDASAFCRRFGGNGHVKAAGCLMSADELLEEFRVLVD